MNPNIFREYDIRGIVGTDLTDETVREISAAIAVYFARGNALKIIVGHDARKSSPDFQKILIEVLSRAGCEVTDIGLVPTPVLYFALYGENADGAVMITGSHNPANHNGFKISLGKNSLYGKQIREIGEIALAQNLNSQFAALGQKRANFVKENFAVTEKYIAELSGNLFFGKRKLKIVVDAGSGTGGLTAVPLYERLGVKVVKLFCEPDSSFPHHEPDPSQEENLKQLIEKVSETRSDFGIAFDGDADRLAVVDETGRIIRGDELMILFAREILRDKPRATIIAEVKCTQVLFDEIERLGGKAIMSKAGHSIIKAQMRETGAILAGEMSGHIFFADRFYGFDDAAYAGARLLEILSNTNEKLSEIFARFPQTFATPEIRIPCPEGKKRFVIEKIIEKFSPNHDINTIDGARIKFKNGWGLARPSNTQALLILRCEANSEARLSEIKVLLKNSIREILTNES